MKLEFIYDDFRDWFLVDDPHAVDDVYIYLNLDIRDLDSGNVMSVHDRWVDGDKEYFYKHTTSVWQSGVVKIPFCFSKILFVPDDNSPLFFKYLVKGGLMLKIDEFNNVIGLNRTGEGCVLFSPDEDFSGRPYAQFKLLNVGNREIAKEFCKTNGLYGRMHFKRGKFGFQYIE